MVVYIVWDNEDVCQGIFSSIENVETTLIKWEKHMDEIHQSINPIKTYYLQQIDDKNWAFCCKGGKEEGWINIIKEVELDIFNPIYPEGR